VFHNAIVRFSVALVVATGITACSPTYNWRQLSFENVPASALMPCKPERSSRDVPLAQPAVKLEVRACDTDGFTFAVSWIVLPPDASADEALASWRQAAAASIRATVPDTPTRSWSVKASDAAGRWTATGQRQSGERVDAEWGYLRQGQILVQMAVYGTKPASPAANQFWDGFAWQKSN